MFNENNLLYSYLAIGLVLAPLMTNHFFLSCSRIYRLAHFFTLGIVATAFLTNFTPLTFVWPVFCAFGAILFLTRKDKTLPAAVPFLFSLISSSWFAAGTNDLHLLGYNRDWSLYAALHGAFLGWMLFGCFAKAQFKYGTFLGLILFLCVAFGIDGVPYVKRVGVIGLSILVPYLIGKFAIQSKQKLAFVSLGSVIVTLTLAVMYEFVLEEAVTVFGMPLMVFVHGGLNAVVTVPCFVAAVFLSERK